jgi:transposase
MPPRSISKDLKDPVPVLFHGQGCSVKEICHLLGVKKSMVYAVLKNHRLIGTTTNINARRRGQHRILDSSDLEFIQTLLLHHHTLYLDEIQLALETQRLVHVSIPTLGLDDAETCGRGIANDWGRYGSTSIASSSERQFVGGTISLTSSSSG